MSDDNFKDFKDFMVAIVNFLQPIANGINRALKDPETIKVIENIAHWMHETERTSPFMDKILSEIKSNSNLSEAEYTLSYKQIFTLLSNSNNIESTNLFDLINQSYFREPLLQCFDKIEISNHFKKRKNIIEEAFKLYELQFYAGCLSILHSQIEGIITDYLIFKKILRKEIKNGKTNFIVNSDQQKKENVSGLKRKLELAKNINENFSRLEIFEFDNNSNIKFHNERNDVLHGSNLDNFTIERCLILFIWIDSIISSIYKDEFLNSLSSNENNQKSAP